MENIKMTEWKTVKIGDLGKIITGKTPSTKVTSYWGNDVPFVTPRDIQISRYIYMTEKLLSTDGMFSVRSSVLPKNSVCVPCIGNIGYVSLTLKECVSNQQINSIVVSDENDACFAYYLMKSLWGYFKKYEGQSTALSILNKSQFSNIDVNIPPLEIQRKIAGILGALDDRIDVLRRENVVLEQMAQAVFQSWFVDFDIVRAKAAGTPESEVCEKYHITPELYALFPSALTPDNLPLGWEKKNLGDISQYSKEKTTNVNIETYVSTENMLPNYGGIEKASSVPETGQSTRYKAGNVLISNIRPYFKKIWFADREGSCSNDVLVFSSNSIGKCMLYSILAQDAFFDFVMSGANGDKMPRGNKKHIMTYPVIFPNMDLLNKFENLVASLFDKKSKNAQQIRALSATRDALLPKLMNGEIEV